MAPKGPATGAAAAYRADLVTAIDADAYGPLQDACSASARSRADEREFRHYLEAVARALPPGGRR